MLTDFYEPETCMECGAAVDDASVRVPNGWLCWECFCGYCEEEKVREMHMKEFLEKNKGEFLLSWFNGLLSAGGRTEVLEKAYKSWKESNSFDAFIVEDTFRENKLTQWREFIQEVEC